MESAFRDVLKEYTGSREGLGKEKLEFAAKQFANRARVAGMMGQTPLNEDSKIFAHLGVDNKLFESVSMPGNIVGLGDVTNPDSSWQHTGGIWNSGYKSGTGDIPSYLFGLQSHLAYHCIGFDLIPAISVDTPKVTLQYVDDVYGGGVFDDAENLPSYIEISNNALTATWANTMELQRITSELIFRAEDGADKPAMQVRFIMRNTAKASVIVEVMSTGTVAADHTYTAGTTLSVKQVLDAINASASPKVVADVGGTATATTLTAAVTKIDYASATRTPIHEASTNDNSMGGMNRAQHRKGPKHKLNVISMDKQVEVKGIEIEADTDNIQIKDMAAMGINVIARLYNGVQNQLVQTLDYYILDHLYALGVQHAVNVVRSQGVNYSLYIDTPANTNLAFNSINFGNDFVWKDMLGADVSTDMGNIANSMVSTTYENQMTHADRLYARLLLVSEFIAYQNRIGGPDFVVLPGALASCLKKNSTFQTCPTVNTLVMKPELHYSGTIFETLNVYNNPKIDFNSPVILLGRRGDQTDPGAKLIAYDLAASRQTIAEQTMAEKIRVWSRFVIADIGFYPELNYYTMVAINKFGWA